MSKRKILSTALVFCMIAILAVGGTLAFYTDTDSQKNTFTTGNVGINLDEVEVEFDDDDNLVAKMDGNKEVRTDNDQTYKLHPDMTVAKDPTITVDATSETAYVGAIVTIKGDLYDLIGVEGYDNIDIHGLAQGGLMADQEGAAFGDYNGLFAFQNNNYAIYQKADKANKTWTLYVFMKNGQAAGSSIKLFEKLVIPATYDNTEMSKLNGMTIEVEAYATQIDGFTDCYDALTSAFGAEAGDPWYFA